MRRRKHEVKHEVKLWLEPGFKEGEDLAWRAQVYEARMRAVSVIGTGPTRQRALVDLAQRLAHIEARAVEPEWLSLEALDAVPHV